MLRRARYSTNGWLRKERNFILVSLLLFTIFLIVKNALNNREEDYASSVHEFKSYIAPVEVPLEFVFAILVVCSTRSEALKNHLDQLLSQRPSGENYPVVISQDGSTGSVRNTALSFADMYPNVTFIRHKKVEQKKNNYASIAKHYKWALDKMFFEFKFSHVLITEDDLDIGSDFFNYFTWAKDVLIHDRTIWCASAWNDNGLINLVDSENGHRIWKTDFFPGLGWLLSRETWEELSPQWPEAYWDDWMRKPEVRQNRTCIRPEVSRTSHNMKLAGKGSSGGLYKGFLSKIDANTKSFNFLGASVEQFHTEYDRKLEKELDKAVYVNIGDVKTTEWTIDVTYKVPYSNVREWKSLASAFGIMSDIRGGMARTAYFGVVPVMRFGSRVFLVPKEIADDSSKLTKYAYDPLWDKQNRYLEFAAVYCTPKRWTGNCDPRDPKMVEWFVKKAWKKRLLDWGEMIVV